MHLSNWWQVMIIFFTSIIILRCLEASGCNLYFYVMCVQGMQSMGSTCTWYWWLECCIYCCCRLLLIGSNAVFTAVGETQAPDILVFIALSIEFRSPTLLSLCCFVSVLRFCFADKLLAVFMFLTQESASDFPVSSAFHWYSATVAVFHGYICHFRWVPS